nr:hypothetical protein GCM10020092_039970 [Actinoplanes digitatis]
MAAETGPDVVVTTAPRLADLPDALAARGVCLDRDAAAVDARPATPPDVAAPDADDISQIAYTSGSTHEPKPVLQRHRTLDNLADWTARAYGVSAEDRASWVSAPGYGIGMLEWMPFLACGAEINIADGRTAATVNRLRDWLVARGVTHALVLNHVAERLAGMFWPERSVLRILVAVGEPMRHWPAPSLPFEVVACYGATEVGAVTSSFDLAERRALHVAGGARGRPGRARAPGRPSRSPTCGCTCWTSTATRCRSGCPASCTWPAPGWPLGYLDRPELAAEAFVPNPLPEEPEPVLYRSGDLARYRADGTIEVVGRADSVVRIRGHQVALRDVEAAVVADAAVRETAVLAHTDDDGAVRLVAYVVPADEAAFSSRTLRQSLANQLPSHLLPSAVVRLPGLPWLPNGKLDRRALPAPPAPVTGVPHVGPRTPVERELADLCVEVLGVERIGVDDDLTGAAVPGRLRDALRALVASRYDLELDDARITSIGRVAALVDAARDGDSFGALPPVEHHPEARFEPFPLTDTQQAYWIGRSDAVELGSVGCHGYWEWESSGLDVDRFRAAWSRVLDRHDMLRAVINPDGTQRILADLPEYEIPVLDLRDNDAVEDEAAKLREHLSHHVTPRPTRGRCGMSG